MTSPHGGEVPAMPLLSVLLAVLLAVLHVCARSLRFQGIPRSRSLSVAGGIAVAYVFVQLLPELAEASEAVGGAVSFVERPAYLLALAGLTLFYAVDRLALRSKAREGRDRAKTPRAASWVGFATYALYNAVIGYVLVREHEDPRSLVLFAVAMGLHFVVNDHALRQHHREDYDVAGRWLVAAAVVAGALIGAATPISETLIAALIAFIAGGVVLNVLKEELPEDRKSSFGAFAAGLVGYTLLLLAV